MQETEITLGKYGQENDKLKAERDAAVERANKLEENAKYYSSDLMEIVDDHNVIVYELEQANKETSKLRADNEMLREALKLFAERMNELEKCKNAAKYGFSTDIEIEHLRRAKEVYENTK